MPRVVHEPEICQFCGNAHAELANLVMDGRVYVTCPDCEADFQCPNCGYFLGRHREELLQFSITFQHMACENCNPDDLCAFCGEAVVEGTLDVAYISGDRYEVCANCLPSFENDIHEYRYKPDPIFHGKDDVHLGLELEFYAPDQGRLHQEFLRVLHNHYVSYTRIFYNKVTEKLTLNKDQRFYFKRDSSLNEHECGAEMVTHPHTLAEHREGVLPFVNDVLKEHCFVDDSCGIHVHIDKSKLSFVDRAKMHTFLLCNQADVCSLAGRYNEEYAEFRRRNRYTKLVDQVNGHERRHSFLNHRPENTVEMRIFSSSTEPEKVLAYLQFAHAMAYFVKYHTLRECTDNASWSKFVAFVKERPQYGELLCLLQEKGLDGVGTCQLAYIPWSVKFKTQTTGRVSDQYRCPYCEDTGCPDCADYDFGI